MTSFLRSRGGVVDEEALLDAVKAHRTQSCGGVARAHCKSSTTLKTLMVSYGKGLALLRIHKPLCGTLCGVYLHSIGPCMLSSPKFRVCFSLAADCSDHCRTILEAVLRNPIRVYPFTPLAPQCEKPRCTS